MKRPQQGKFHLYGVSNDELAWLSHLKKFSKPLQSRPASPACRYGEALGLFLAGRRWLKPASRPLSGLGKGAGGLSGETRWAPAVCLGNSGQQTWSCCVRRQ